MTSAGHKLLTPILREAVLGEESRGSDGVVYCNEADKIVRYMKIHEIESQELRERVEDMVTEEGCAFYFVIEEIERVMHIWKFPKNEAMQRMMQVDESQKSEAGAA